ncbi:hypothetical protein [Nocardia crassostreae]|uniref:hypothetical protein n=1 Tax=Nocardia crassostreae TaxID=53428 RepID=UPI00083443F0|nr:hypothetical protein [Nocardia crassostreae]
MSVEGRFEEIGRRARRVQQAIEGVRGTASVGAVRIEVAADGRITTLALPDPALAQAVSFAHEKALRQTRERAADLRRELADDPAVAGALRWFLAAAEPERPGPARPVTDSGGDPGDENPYALPPEVRRRLGL